MGSQVRRRKFVWAAVAVVAVAAPVAAIMPGVLHHSSVPVIQALAGTEVKGGDPGVVRSREVQLTAASLPAADVTTPQPVALPLFQDTTVHVNLGAATTTNNGFQTWSGKVAGDDGSTVVVVAKGNVVSGVINGLNGTYRLAPTANGTTRVEQVDQSVFAARGDGHVDPPSKPGDPQFPTATYGNPAPAAAPAAPTGGPGSPRSMADVSTSPATSATATSAAPAIAASTNPGPTVTILMGYTTAAMQRAGSEAAIAADIQTMITMTNQAYADSGINVNLQLAGTVEEPTNSDVTGTALGQVVNPSDGVYDDLNVQRDQLGADLVSLVVDSTSGPYCGIAYVMPSNDTSFAPYAASVTDLGCALYYGAFTHELGHNFGAAHDRADGSSATAWSGYSFLPYGYAWNNPSKHWQTVMAYPNACSGCAHLLRYSNPDITYNGDPMGAPIGQPNQADNMAVLNTTASTVSSFRGPAQPASFTVTGPTAGQPVTASGTLDTTWTTTGNVGSKVKIDLYKGGTFVSTLATSAAVGAGHYAYTLPLSTPRGTDYSIKATPVLSPGLAVQSPTFSVVDPTITAAYTLTSPTEGGTAQVSWTYTGAPGGAVRVELLKDGKSIAVLTTNAALGANGAGNTTVTFPAALNNGGGYSLQTTLTAVPTATATTSSFSLTSSRQLVITAPAGGVTVQAGTPLTVNWTAAGTLGSWLRADLYKGNTMVASSGIVPPTTGTITFTTPASIPTGSDYQVLLTALNYPTVAATSSTFNIHGSSISVTSPSTPTSVVAGTTTTISFNYTGSPGSLVSLTAVASGHSYTINNGVPLAAGSYTWQVPLYVPQGTYTVHAVVFNNPLVTADSTAPLTVTWPSVSIADPAPAVAGANATINWAFSDGASAPVRIRLMNGTTEVTTLATGAATGGTGTGSFTTRLPITLKPGTYTVEVAAVTNLALLATSTNPLTVTYPTISVTSPPSAIAGANLSVSWAFSDGAIAPARIRLMQGITAVLTLSGAAPTAANGTGSFTTRLPITLPQGTYTVEVAAAVNPAVISTSPTPLTVTYPAASLSGPPSATAGQTVTFTWSLGAGVVAPVRLRLLNGPTVVTTIAGIAATNGSGNGSLTYQMPINLPVGNYKVDIAATENAAITSTTSSFPITVPTLSGSGSPGVARGQVATISWAFTGGASVPVRIDLVNSSTGAVYNTISYSYETAANGSQSMLWRSPTWLAPGTYTLRIRPAVMAASNTIETTRAFVIS